MIYPKELPRENMDGMVCSGVFWCVLSCSGVPARCGSTGSRGRRSIKSIRLRRRADGFSQDTVAVSDNHHLGENHKSVVRTSIKTDTQYLASNLTKLAFRVSLQLNQWRRDGKWQWRTNHVLV